MRNDTSVAGEADAVTIRAGGRDKERKLEVVVTLPGGAEPFKDWVWVKDRQECRAFLERFCAAHRGVDAEDRVRLRDAMNRIRKAHELDIDIHLPHKVNGTGKISIDYYSGSRIAWSSNGDLVNDTSRRTLADKIARVHLGNRKTSPAALKRLVDLVDRRLLDELETMRRKSATPAAPPVIDAEKVQYERVDGVGMVWLKPAQGGNVPQLLTNFTARILANVVRTDGVERSRDLEVEAALRGNPPRRFTVRAADFEKMKWPMLELGGEAVIEPEDGFDRRARVAIQKLSPDVPEKLLHTHTGWVERDGRWLYLHAGGAIAADDAPAGIDVALGDALARYQLPAPPADPAWLKQCVRASLRVLDLGAPHVVYPLYCSIWRPLLGECDLSTFINGRTQSFKSELASLVARHFGAGMHAKALSGSWDSTLNHLRDMAFKLRDAIFVIDDFKPGVLKARDAAEMHKLADRILRAQGNLSERGRCDEYGNSRASKRPQGMILATGEELPFGQSLRARMWIVDLSPRDIDSSVLSLCQADAREGLYAAAMAGGIRWLATGGRIGGIRGGFRSELEAQRPAAVDALRGMNLSGDDLRRTTDNTLNLQLAFGHFLRFALQSRAVTDGEASKLHDQCWAALVQSAELQARHQRDEDPVSRFFHLLRSALSSGLAYVSAADGSEPPEGWKLACGYRKRGSLWEPGRTRVGSYLPRGVALDTEASFRIANDVVGPSGDGIGVSSPAALGKHLAAKGMLVTSGDDEHGRRTGRQRIDGRLRTVWCVPHHALEIPGPEEGGVFRARRVQGARRG